MAIGKKYYKRRRVINGIHASGLRYMRGCLPAVLGKLPAPFGKLYGPPGTLYEPFGTLYGPPVYKTGWQKQSPTVSRAAPRYAGQKTQPTERYTMSRDYIPRNDEAFDTFFKTLTQYVARY